MQMRDLETVAAMQAPCRERHAGTQRLARHDGNRPGVVNRTIPARPFTDAPPLDQIDVVHVVAQRPHQGVDMALDAAEISIGVAAEHKHAEALSRHGPP